MFNIQKAVSRLNFAPKISEIEITDIKNGVGVFTPKPEKAVSFAALKESLKAAVGKDVTLQSRVDPSILGGLIVKVGSRMIDSSLKTKLQNMKTALSGAGA